MVRLYWYWEAPQDYGAKVIGPAGYGLLADVRNWKKLPTLPLLVIAFQNKACKGSTIKLRKSINLTIEMMLTLVLNLLLFFEQLTKFLLENKTMKKKSSIFPILTNKITPYEDKNYRVLTACLNQPIKI